MNHLLLRVSCLSVCLVLIFFSNAPSLLADEATATSNPPASATPSPTPDDPLIPIPPATPPPLPTNVEVFSIKTSSVDNPEVPFYVRKPAGYDPAAQGKVYRVLFLCPGLGGKAIDLIDDTAVMKMADSNGWFLIAPTYRMRRSEAHDRSKSFYYPAIFAGQSVLDALDEIAKKYPIDTHHLLLSGASGGGHFVHRFAAWAPDRVVAVIIYSCSWFDSPTPAGAKIAWLLLVGDSDPAYKEMLDFVSQLKGLGALPIMKSVMGQSHAGLVLDKSRGEAFLTFYDKLTAADLGKDTSAADKTKPTMAMSATNMPFVGDLQSFHYVTNTEENRKKINEDDRVYLPSEEIAKMWGVQDE